jgi:hypothetical protein
MNAMTASNMFYAEIYNSMGLLFIGSAFLLWLGMRVTSVLVERDTDNPVAKGLAVLFGLAVGANFIFIGVQMALTQQRHAWTLNNYAEQGMEIPQTATSFIEQMGVGSALPEPSLLGNPILLVIGLIGTAFCILPLFVPANSSK